MEPSTYDLHIYRGDSYHWRFRAWQDAGMTQPVDLTDVAVEAEIRTQPGGAGVVALACTITLPNSIDVVLTATASRSVPSRGVWDLELTYPNGDVSTIVAGDVTLTLDVTNSVAAAASSGF